MNVAYNVDCMEYMRTLPDKAFDLAVVDPPYGIKISNNMGRRKGDRPSEYKKVTWDAAWDAGLDFVGCEIDLDYFNAQEERFKEHTAQENLFLQMEMLEGRND